MSIRNHAIYEIDVTYTQQIQHRDAYGERTGVVTETPNVPVTHRLIAPKYEEGQKMAVAWVEGRYKYSGGCKVVAVRELELGAFIEAHTY